jgi:AraC-like DNA-binding protein
VINYYRSAQTNTEVYKQVFCKDLLFVYYDCPLGCERQDRWSENNYILYVLSGKKVLYTTTRIWLLTSGTAVFVKKGACIVEKVNEGELRLLALFIPDKYLQHFLVENKNVLATGKNISHDTSLVLPLDVNEMMRAYFDSLIPYFFSTAKPPDYLLELKFRELLFNIIANPVNTELKSFLNTVVSSQSNNIQSIIEANYCYNLTIGEYAKLCNRSLSSFKRDFYNLYGESPARWLLEKRLVHSLRLLCNSNIPIVDISFESGFENSTHFSHAFKKHFGLSPSKYRQKNSTIEH